MLSVMLCIRLSMERLRFEEMVVIMVDTCTLLLMLP